MSLPVLATKLHDVQESAAFDQLRALSDSCEIEGLRLLMVMLELSHLGMDIWRCAKRTVGR